MTNIYHPAPQLTADKKKLLKKLLKPAHTPAKQPSERVEDSHSDYLAYWQEQLRDMPSLLQLPTSKLRSATPTFEDASYDFHISVALTTALRELSRREDSTLFETLLAAFQIWLVRHCNQEDITVSTPISRTPASNTLMLRTNLTGNPSFSELLKLVHQVLTHAYDHQDVPFEKIVEIMQPKESMPDAPLHQVCFSLDDATEAHLQAHDHHQAHIDTATKYDLFLALTECENDEGTSLNGRLKYNQALFDETTSINFVQRFYRLLEAIVVQPHERIWSLQLLPAQEYKLLTLNWGATQQLTTLAQNDTCLHHLFEAQVQRTPDALALVMGHEQFTYAQLNQYANLLARSLQHLGVGPEVLVGLCLPRSPLLLVALLAILKAGGAYVPLDPTYPPDRLRFQAQDAHLHLLVTSQHLKTLGDEIAVPQFHLDHLPSLSAPSEMMENLDAPMDCDHLAYLIYTSGSTGRPKGVSIAHRNTVAMVGWAQHHYSPEDLRGVLAGTSICFDLSLFELFVPWNCGGTIYLAETSLHQPTDFQNSEITLLNTVPSAMNELLRTRAIPSSVRVVNMAGEPLPRPLVNQLYELPGIQRVYNLYGPTEDTTYSTWALLSSDEPHASVPIGRPLDGSQIYLLDPYGQPVPIGVVGEIYLGGVGVTRGYWQRPELTAERYLPDPFGHSPGGRLYRTGDLARYRPDGALECQGRIDHQVKIRGFRIELGEIESLLRRQPQIEDCVVVARQDAAKTRDILVAYLVPNEPQEDLEEQMSAILKTHLPHYMIPNFFVLLSALPKNSNGKVDRKALPDPQITKEPREAKPQTPSQVKIEQALNLSTGKKALLKKLLKQDNTTSTLPLTVVNREGKDTFPLSFAQQRLWLQDQLDPEATTYNIPLISRLRGNLNRKALIRSLNEIVKRHEALRTAFLEVQGAPMQRIAPASAFRVSRIDLRHHAAEDQHQLLDDLLTEEAVEPFDLQQGLLIRVRLIQLHDDEHILCVIMHHIASDGWSIDIFQRELLALYAAFDQDKPSPLPALPIQYIDYAIWQRRWLQGSVLNRQLSYWQKQLSNLPTLLPLPTDHPRPAIQTFRGATYQFLVPAELTSALKELSQCEGVTLFMTLLAAFQVWLAHHCNQEDIPVGTPIANRQRIEVEALIGFFVNTLVMRADLSRNPSFNEVLQRVREMSMQAYNYQDLPFDQVVNAVQSERSLDHSPLFQVLFSMQNITAKKTRPRGLQIEAIQPENTIAKFDLSLDVQEQSSSEGNILKAEFEYNCDLFEATTIVRFAQRLLLLLESIVAQPHTQIWKLDMLPVQERDFIQHMWNTSQAEIMQKQIIDADPTQLAPDNYHIHLLDQYQCPVPVGVVGEVYLDNNDNCLYRTGKRARYRIDGEIEYQRHVEEKARSSPTIPGRKEEREQQSSPQTLLEQEIAAIWSNVLGIDPPGRAENFFEIGGHSLLGVRVIARIRSQLEVDLSLRHLFEAPTVQELAQIIETVRKREVTTSNDIPQGMTEPELIRVAHDQPQLLSFEQQRLWLLEQLDPGTPTYNIPIAVGLSGPLHKRALAQSLRTIIARHETLRTTFHINDGIPTQHITTLASSAYPINFSLIDARSWSPDEQEQLAFLFINEEASQPFDLETGPLMRGHLLWLDNYEYILLLTIHHIISDGWSIEVISQELSTLYQAFSTGEPSPLQELPIQYIDYAIWQRQKLQGEALARKVQYWKHQLAGLPAVLALPTDRPRPPRQTFNGRNYIFHLPRALTEALQHTGQSEGVTLFMKLLTTFQILLCRYSGQEDIVVGTPIANRTHVDVENLIGFFINTLALRIDLRGGPSFSTLLQRVRSTVLDAYQHQDVPFEQVVNAVQKERDLAYAPLCQVMFQLQNLSQQALELTDITLKTIEIESTTSKFDISLTMSENEQGLSGEFEYNSDLFDQDTIVRMATHFQHLLEGAVAQPEQQIWHLPMLSQTEFQQLVFDWNQTEVAYPQELSIHQLIETWAEQKPDTLALIAGDECITYRELNQRANQLAHYLLIHKLQPENIVGIYQERTIAMIVSLLAVFKAGGAYIPIDPSYPADRLTFMLKDSQATILLTQQSLAHTLPDIPGITSIKVDSKHARIAQENSSNPSVALSGDNRAYVIYTSGSTGTPKGVAIQHRSLLNMIYWYQRTFCIQHTDKSTFLAGLGFDATIWELWPALAAGTQIHLADDETRISPQLWQNWITQQGITVSFLPTPLVEQVLALDWSQPTSLRLLTTGGDQLHHYPAPHIPFALFNNYGPTENTVVATSSIVPVSKQSERLPMIGRPIANTQIYILDKEFQPQPIGIPGEMYIGGSSLAHGYLHRPDLTAERFIPHPFSTQAGARLYRTGDLVRYLADGSLEFLGRRDFQVKIRGYRIELGEIATLLAGHSEIRDNIVVVREDNPQEKRLVAYVVLRQPSRLTSEQVQDYLREKLPVYMVPSAIVLLDELPTNANGKVDRQALPPPYSNCTLERAYVKPRDTIELKLTSIWENLLQNGPISITDDFFELGGHSLLAVRLMAQIQREFRQELSLSVLFQGATLEHIAMILRQHQKQEKRSPLVAIQPGGNKRPFFCVHPVGGEVLCYTELARQLGPEQPFYGLQMLQVEGTDQQAQPEYGTSIEEMAHAYLVEVQRIQPDGPYLLGGWSLGGVIAFEMAQQLERQGHAVALLALFDSYAPSIIQQQHETSLVQQFAEDLEGLFDATFGIDYAKLQTFSHEEQLARLYHQLKRANVVPPDIETAYLSRLFSTYRQNINALYRYEPQKYTGNLTLFSASASAQDEADNIHGWPTFLEQEPTVHTISGNHYTILKNPHLERLVQHLQHSMAVIGGIAARAQ